MTKRIKKKIEENRDAMIEYWETTGEFYIAEEIRSYSDNDILASALSRSLERIKEITEEYKKL